MAVAPQEATVDVVHDLDLAVELDGGRVEFTCTTPCEGVGGGGCTTRHEGVGGGGCTTRGRGPRAGACRGRRIAIDTFRTYYLS